MSFDNADVPAAPPWLQDAAEVDVAAFGAPRATDHSVPQQDSSPVPDARLQEPSTEHAPGRHGQAPTSASEPPIDEPQSTHDGHPTPTPHNRPSPDVVPTAVPQPHFSAAHDGPAPTAFDPLMSQSISPAPAPQPGPPHSGPPHHPGPPQYPTPDQQTAQHFATPPFVTGPGPAPSQHFSTTPPPHISASQPASHTGPGPAQHMTPQHHAPHTYPGPAGFAPQPPVSGPATLDEVALLRKARRAPASGWRRTVHKLSAGAINPGESPDDLIYKQLLDRVNQPVRGDYRIAVLSLKGGVGKTTATVGLGSTFASLRGDRVIAVDANPDLGTLAQRIPQQTRSTVRDLLSDESIYRYSDVRAHTSQAPSRLEVLASERDPAVAEAFSETDYRGVMTVLQRFYNIIITDCGTGLSHSAMNGVLDMANSLILVTSPAIDGARSAGATLDWLQAHGFGHLVSGAVVVLSSSRPGASTIDTGQLSAHFLTRCRAVQQIPFDDHLAEGAEVDLDLLGKTTRRAFVELAATVAEDFSTTASRRGEPFYNS
ncbi:AAA family ATPase [Williamsia muralis]|uniref:ATPase n=1 Tax=Williamsia marianensis TaxID=85044 RepID=A0A2G3PIK4_WILMA|nr:AAA family ATPase [Williamsia marianensis]PHV65647.1 ATPase [Williamsia marianensis]